MGAKLHYPDGLKVILFASGRGSNAVNLIKFSQEYAAFDIAAVACDYEDAQVVNEVKKLGIPVLVHQRKSSHTKRTYEQGWIDLLKDYQHDLALLCGYMKILGPDFLNFYKNDDCSFYHVVNIHPSLLPKYPGLDGYKQTFNANEELGGVTVHLVDEGVDSGLILRQESFERKETDDLESFMQRGLALEHRLYREFIKQLIEVGVEIQK